MSNFIPNETKRFVPRDPPWITKSLKTMLNKKKDISEITKGMDIKLLIKFGLTLFVLNVNKLLNQPKLVYLNNLGNKINDPNTSQKSNCRVATTLENPGKRY